MRNINLIIDCFERNLKIFLYQSEVKEDRDITILILEECLNKLHERKIIASVTEKYEEYFKILVCATRAELILEEHISSLENDINFILIYRDIIRLLARKK